MKKKTICLILILVLCFSLGITARADSSEVNQTRQSVVVVRPCLDLNNYGTIYLGWGSGFFIDDGTGNPTYLVTNYHVITDFIFNGSGELITYYENEEWYEGRAKIRVYYDSEDYEEAYYVTGDAIKDIAILKLVSNTSKRAGLKFMSPADNMVGSDIWAVGFPGLSDNSFADATTMWGTKDATVTKGAISRLFTQSGTGVSEVQIDCDIKHGNSGGPLVNEWGYVLGLTTWGVSSETEVDGINYAISIDEVMTLMKQNNLSYTLGVIPEKTEPTPEPGNGSKGHDLYFWLIIGIAAVIVIAAIIILIAVLTSRKKKNAPAAAGPAFQPPVQQPVPAAKTAYVRSLSSQHRGNRIPVSEGETFIGRSRDCGIVFRDGTPGVSSRHCSLRWDNASRDFVLTDLNSSYGTFLQNGQRLTANVPYHISVGEQFYLGENSNMLRVELE